MGYRTYVRNDNGGGLLLIVFGEGGKAVLAFDVYGRLYPSLYWRDETTFANAHHYTRFDS